MILMLSREIDPEHLHRGLDALGLGGHSIAWQGDRVVLKWEQAPRTGVDWSAVLERARSLVAEAPSAAEGRARERAEQRARAKVRVYLETEAALVLAAEESDDDVRAALLRIAGAT